MADKEDDITISLDEDEVVTVPVDDNVRLAQEPEHIKTEAKKTKEPKTKRVSPEPEQVAVNQGPTHEEALAQAQAYSKTQEDARRAAEATAANERQLREQAQREATQAREHAEAQRERADTSELNIIENGIASATREVEAYESEYTRAAEAGEFAKMASIQTKMSKAASRLDRLESEKAAFDSGQRRQTTEGRVEAQPVVQPAAEQYLSQFAPAAQSWLRQHPECLPSNLGGDSVKNSKMMQGHYAAMSKSIALNTPEYFKEIEASLNPTEVQPIIPQITSKAAEVTQAAVEPKPAKHVQPSAPPSRDTPAANGNQPRNVREVRLTKDQQEMAKVSFPHLPEAQAYGQYARNLIELEAEGKLGRVTH